MQFGEKGLSFYIMSAKWVRQWHMWVASAPNAERPGMIRNKDIAQKIMEYRKNSKRTCTLHDGLALKEPKDVFFVSKEFLMSYVERYGIDVVI